MEYARLHELGDGPGKTFRHNSEGLREHRGPNGKSDDEELPRFRFCGQKRQQRGRDERKGLWNRRLLDPREGLPQAGGEEANQSLRQVGFVPQRLLKISSPDHPRNDLVERDGGSRIGPSIEKRHEAEDVARAEHVEGHRLAPTQAAEDPDVSLLDGDEHPRVVPLVPEVLTDAKHPAARMRGQERSNLVSEEEPGLHGTVV